MNLVTVRQLRKQYDSFLLQDVSFALESGHIAGFIGRNGAGKTTTIKAMMNLISADGGEVSFFGMSLREHEKEIKERIGYSCGTVSFYQKKKLKEIAGVTRTFYKNWDDAAYERYKNLFRLDDPKTPAELSEGMKVKFTLLLALSHHAEVLILDEPTSGLDPFSREELLEVFEYLKKQGVGILFSTHIISDIEKCADDILYIQEGQMRACCSMETFRKEWCQPNETVEQAMLRLERRNIDEKTFE